MKSVKLEDEIYDLIMEKVATTGKSPSGVLRSQFGLDETSSTTNGQSNQKDVIRRDEASQELAEFLDSPRLRSHGTVVKKYLAILSFVYQQKPDSFDQIETAVTGRSRKYFGTSKQELNSTGSSVNPHSIPKSPYWAVTNNSTPKKRDIMEDVLNLLGYEKIVIQKAQDVL